MTNDEKVLEGARALWEELTRNDPQEPLDRLESDEREHVLDAFRAGLEAMEDTTLKYTLTDPTINPLEGAPDIAGSPEELRGQRIILSLLHAADKTGDALSEDLIVNMADAVEKLIIFELLEYAFGLANDDSTD